MPKKIDEAADAETADKDWPADSSSLTQNPPNPVTLEVLIANAKQGSAGRCF